MIYYHNPRCRKSREGLTFLNEKNIQPEIRDYLKEGLTHHELRSILEKLDMRPDELMRKSETIYKTEIKGKKLTDDQLIIKMIEHPKLMERPILVLGNKATIGRPAENFMSIMG
tara:strand:+ start:1870 stop:2211 length:342 start_codon:yes stop_codon:yes gene_type:complete